MKEAKDVKIILDNEELANLLKEKGELIEQGKKLSMEVEEKQNELNSIGMLVQKLKDKMMPILSTLKEQIDAEIKKECDSTIDASNYWDASIELKDGKIIATPFNFLLEVKAARDKQILENAASKDKKEDTTSGENK